MVQLEDIILILLIQELMGFERAYRWKRDQPVIEKVKHTQILKQS